MRLLQPTKLQRHKYLRPKSQYDMARNGSRLEEKQAAAGQVTAARGAVNVVKSLLKETVQVATMEGEVSDVYPKIGELVGIGSPDL